MADFQPPPTFAEVILVEQPKHEGDKPKVKFNPIWLKWFLDLVQVINDSGGGGGTITHNDTAGLQGGTANQYFHLTSAQHASFPASFGTMAGQNSNNVSITGGDIALTERLQQAQGAVVTAANNLVLGSDGNYFQIDGATQINLLSSTGWQGGSVVTLKFNSTPTVKDGQATSGANKQIKLAGAADFVASATDNLTLVYDSTDSIWYEIGRTVI